MVMEKGKFDGVKAEVPSVDRVSAVVDGWKGLRVAVIGDVMLDRFWNVYPSGKDPKDDSPVYCLADSVSDNERGSLGGAGNLAENVEMLGYSECGKSMVAICGVMGNDSYSTELSKLCYLSNMKVKMYMDENLLTTVREYIVNRDRISVEELEGRKGEIFETKTLMRMDYDSGDKSEELGKEGHSFQLELWRFLLDERLDGIILSDYCLGVVNKTVVNMLASFMCTDRGKDLRVVVDTRSADLSKFESFMEKGVSDRVSLIISDKWMFMPCGVSESDDEGEKQRYLCCSVREECERLKLDAFYLTRGGMPAFLYSSKRNPSEVSAVVDVVAPYDIDVKCAVGAGDSSTAVFALCYFSECDVLECANFAQVGGAISASIAGITVLSSGWIKSWVKAEAEIEKDDQK